MTLSRADGPSRPSSSRATSVVENIRKRREKPYKTETRKVLAKKKKLELHTSYRRAPQGYTFLSVGTPDLAARCKELSRQRGFAVNVVNAHPVSRHAHNPEKVSHHIHRIGYHFKSEVVEEASNELGYVIYRGQFLRETDIGAQDNKSFIDQVAAQHGFRMNQPTMEETDQARAAIKELFPKIPEEDLDQIVTRAWQEGSRRVGTNSKLDLPRRVQLAVIARIRHEYTDYDQLLRAFQWSEARSIVEKECLKKLIEWRGENDDENDAELEEIVRETIVIDDDDDDEQDPANGSEADDEDSDAENGDTSDASVEFIHQLAADEDLGAESVDERSRNFLRRYQPRSLRTDQQKAVARQMIGAVRQEMRNAPPPQASYASIRMSRGRELTVDRKPVSVHVQRDQGGRSPETVLMDGKVYLRAPRQVETRQAAPNPQHQGPPQHAYSPQYLAQMPSGRLQPSPLAPNQPTHHQNYDPVMPSIEAHVPTPEYVRQPYTAATAIPPVTPERDRADKRRRLEYSPNHLRPAGPRDHLLPTYRQPSGNGNSSRRQKDRGEVIDLTSPDRRNRSGNPSPMRDIQPTTVQYADHERYGHNKNAYMGNGLHERPSLGANAVSRAPSGRRNQPAPEPVPYDPRQPLLQLPEQRSRPNFSDQAHPGPIAQPYHTAPGQYGAMPQYTPPNLAQSRPAVYVEAPYHPTLYQQLQPHYPPIPPTTPQPIHGAPAPVQQVPRDDGSVVGQQPTAYLQQAQPPIIGAPHPAQYYRPR